MEKEKRLKYSGIIDAARLAAKASRTEPVAIGYDWSAMRILAQQVDEETLYVSYKEPMQEHVVILWRPYTMAELVALLMRYEDQYLYGQEMEVNDGE